MSAGPLPAAWWKTNRPNQTHKSRWRETSGIQKTGGIQMSEEKIFMRVDEVAETLGISKSHAYKIVHQLNKEMAQMGYITVSGRVNRKYFMKKLCYSENETGG